MCVPEFPERMGLVCEVCVQNNCLEKYYEEAQSLFAFAILISAALTELVIAVAVNKATNSLNSFIIPP